MAPLGAPAAAAVGALAIAAYARWHRARVELERRMVGALVRSRPRCPRAVEVPGLEADVRAHVTADGVTRIEADSWLDAIRALGYAMGRDRTFQLDLLRRTATGRLSEAWGTTALPVDVRYRAAGLEPAARRAAAALEAPERDVLTAFAAGVNAALEAHGPPFECRFLSYRPAPWAVEDSLAVALLMLHTLTWNEPAKRADAVIRRTLPEPVARFFLPGDAPPEVPDGLARARGAAEAPHVVVGERPAAGSNCWVIGMAEAPFLACDLHLPLTIPSVLYEVDLRSPGERVRGLAVAGLPAVLIGTNGRIAWGVTDLSADVLDVVPVGHDGSERLTTRSERIRVRGAREARVDVTCDGTMPVSGSPLLGDRVAVRWTGHDARTCDVKFLRLARAASVEEGMRILDDADGIPLNVLVADAAGRMAHLAAGLIPRRPAGAPPASADGYLDGAERPRTVDSPERILVSANDAALPDRPFRIGYDVDPGYRARRIRRVLTELREAGDASAAAMRLLQHDTVAELYEAYRELAVPALAGRDDAAAGLLAGWDGRADVDSRAFGVLVRLREIFARRVLSPYLADCRESDPGFEYAFRCLDRPLLAILRSREPSLLPPGAERDGWDAFVAGCVGQAVAEVGGRAPRRRIPRWGELNAVGLAHPLEPLAPWSRSLLGVAPRPQGGALHTVRTCVPGFSAVGRAVLSPAVDGVTAFELPGGQSGHPLSVHYDDRHRTWSRNVPRRERRRRRAECAYTLRPARSKRAEVRNSDPSET